MTFLVETFLTFSYICYAIYTPFKGLTCGLLNITKADAATKWIDWGNFRNIVTAATN